MRISSLSLWVITSGCLFACSGEVTGGARDDGGQEVQVDAGAIDWDANDECIAETCSDLACGVIADGCGGQLDCGVCTLIASEAGCFLEVVDPDSLYERVVGVVGIRSGWMSFDYDVIHGGWRQDLYDREVLNHGLFGLSRNVPEFVGRYILGNAAQIRPGDAGLSRKSVFYGRVDLEPRPAGQGWMGYTSWRDNIAWQVGETYHVHVVLDAVAAEQILDVRHGADLLMHRVAPIEYFEPSLTSSAFTLSLGGVETDEREVKPLGWRFCDLEVHAEAL